MNDNEPSPADQFLHTLLTGAPRHSTPFTDWWHYVDVELHRRAVWWDATFAEAQAIYIDLPRMSAAQADERIIRNRPSEAGGRFARH